MDNLGTLFALGGFIVAALAQLGGAVIAFRLSVIDGVLSLLVPGYVLFAAKRSGVYWQVAGAWLGGIAAVAVGAVLLS